MNKASPEIEERPAASSQERVASQRKDAPRFEAWGVPKIAFAARYLPSRALAKLLLATAIMSLMRLSWLTSEAPGS